MKVCPELPPITLWALPVHQHGRLEARDVCKGSIASNTLSHAVSMPYWGRGYKL